MNSRSKKGITLVELIVAMTLTSIFAVLCVMLINPIERTYKSTLKLARAQLLADTLIDSIRKECDDVKHDDKASVWITNLSGDDSALLSTTAHASNDPSGNTLVIRRNNNFAESIYAGAGINSDISNVVDNTLTPTGTAHAVETLMKTDPVNLNSGYVHFGYYQGKEDDSGFYPIEAYDYTNPVMAKTYGDFTVELNFDQLALKDDKYPAFVVCTVKIMENGKKVYSRSAVLCFAANGSGHGSGSGGSVTPKPVKKDVEVIVKWDDGNVMSKRPADGITITLKNGDGTVLRTYSLSGTAIRTTTPQRFKFVNVNVSGDYSVSQSPDPAADGYNPAVVKKTANKFVITNKYSSVTLLSGPAFNAVLDEVTGKSGKKSIVSVIFGTGSGVDLSNADKIKNVAINAAGEIQPDYKLYYFAGIKTAYVVSEDGRFIANTNCSSMFSGCEGLTGITWNENNGSFVIDTTNTTNMDSMFKNCKAMTAFNVRDLVKGNCTSTASMFEGCSHAEKINNMDTWNTSKVKDMSRMFYYFAYEHADDKEVSIDVSHFNFSSCEDMTRMFANAEDDAHLKKAGKPITEIKFPAGSSSNLTDMNKVKHMDQMFYSNNHLLKITGFNCLDCGSLLSANKMFDYCGDITELNINNLKMPKCDFESQYSTANGKQGGFLGCDSLEVIILDGWDISSETNLRDFFGYRSNLKKVSLKNCTAPNLESVEGLFYQCTSLEEAYLPNFVGEKCETIRSIFYQCYNLKSWDISGWKTGHVKYMRTAFYYTNSDCATPLKLDLSSWDFDSAIDLSEFCACAGFSEIEFKTHSKDNPMSFDKAISNRRMFAECPRLTKIENFNHATFNSLEPFINKPDEHGNQKKDYGTDAIFYKCTSLTSLDISGLKMPTSESIRNMFNSCSSLTQVNMNDVNLTNCTTFNDAFTNCTSLNRIEMNRINLGKATSLEFIAKPTNVKQLYMAKATLPAVTSLNNLFQNRILEYVDFSDIDLPACTDTAKMFYGCGKLTEIHMNRFKTPANITCYSMFENCYSVKVFEAAEWNTENVTNMSRMFYNFAYYDGNKCKFYDKIDVDISSFDFNSVQNFKEMFMCTKPGDAEDTWKKDRIDKVYFPSVANGGNPHCDAGQDLSFIFRFRKGISSVENLGELTVNIATLTTLQYMFSNIGAYTLDISGINLTGYTKSVKNMFDTCSRLTTIYVATGTDWSGESFSDVTNFFYNSVDLVGHDITGTHPDYHYTSSKKDFARVNGINGKDGYFTAKS